MHVCDVGAIGCRDGLGLVLSIDPATDTITAAKETSTAALPSPPPERLPEASSANRSITNQGVAGQSRRASAEESPRDVADELVAALFSRQPKLAHELAFNNDA
ncbi:hypothetical protein [Mesorhizobium carmichaelinearum]|uniref:hypothetical protein n=1 Tax=Mesorhizobium carmichaelinearum TaxID=1208188 RepID=UPI000BA43D4B|nr:hypothetical protein [Mesorhizobium carmichaelinearum]